ncbi:MAG TPA: hypothetical protein VFZ10_13395 [Geminicoccaceae bacterium]
MRNDLIRVRASQYPWAMGWDTAHAMLFLASDESRYVTGMT